jgi:purine operon repressor
METKGIPIATEVARMMNVPLVIARRDSRAYEGSAVKINYIAGNGVDLETMALARRAVKPGQKALIVDDFMKAGGTLRGMSDLMHEFQVDVAGIAVLISASKEAAEKLNVKSILSLEGFDELNNRVIVRSTGHFE